MPELNDRQTDELFQVGAERHGFEYNEAAWNQMKALLDADARLLRWKWLVGSIVGALAVALLTWVAWPVADAVTTTAATPVAVDGSQPSTTLSDVTTDANDGQMNVSGGSLKATAQQQDPQEVTNASAQDASLSVTTSDSSLKAKITSSSKPNQSAIGGSGNEVELFTSEVPSSPSISAQQTVGGGSELAPNEINATPRTIEGGLASASSPEATTAVGFIPSLALVGVAQDDVQLAELSVTPTGRESAFERSGHANGFAVIASAGLILGQAGSDPFEEARPRFGLELEYRLGKKFAIGTGAFYNEVCYRTEERNFSTKDEFWDLNDGLRPNEIQGQCQVLEVPIAAKYYLNGSANNSLYVGAGASTYILLKEEYKVFYDPDFEPIKSAWDVKGENQHYLGMGHFSLGYQRRLRGGSYLKLEGFVQTPFTGIGEGAVRLLTTGVSVNYQFDFRK